MPIAAAAMIAVPSQPKTVSHFVNVNWPITAVREGHEHNHRHDRHRRDAIDHGAPNQRLDRIERSKIERGPN
jgi:hypothetical protein